MAVQYRVSGDVPVTPAIAPVQHNWNPLYRSLELDEAKRQAKAKAEAEAQEAKAKQAAEEAKYNPGGVLDIDYNDAVHKKGMEVLDYSAKSYASGKTGSAEHNYNINKLRQEAELYKGKANAAIEASKSAYANIDQLPKYVNKNLLNTEVLKLAHPKKGKEIDFDAINPEAIAAVPANYYGAINSVDMYDDKGKDWAEKIQKGEIQFPSEDPNNPEALRNVFKSDMYKAKFFKPIADKYGKITYVPGVTDKTAQFIMENDPEILGEAKYRYEKYIEEETKARAISYANSGQNKDPREVYNEVARTTPAGKFMLDYVKGHLERINAPTHETENKTTVQARPGGDKEDTYEIVRNGPKEYNVNLGNDSGIKTAWSPDSYQLTPKGEDKPMSITVLNARDANTNTKLKLVGPQEIRFNQVKLKPYVMEGQTKVYLPNTEEEVKELIKKGKQIQTEWIAEGLITKRVPNPEDPTKYTTEEKPIDIPYEEVKDKIKTHTGLDLDQRPIEAISDFELVSNISKQYPKATAQQKLAIFKKARDQ